MYYLGKKFNFLVLVLLLEALNFSAQGSGTFAQTGTEELSLNGIWRFAVDSMLSESQEWTKPNYQSEQWDQLLVPGNWDTENAYAHFSGTGYYRRQFAVPVHWKGSRLRLYFGAVYQTAEVWVNGQYLGKHVGGYTPFEFEITGIVHPGQNNTIALSANNEYGYGAWWHWGGISREVKLVRHNDQRIVWQHVVAEPDMATSRAHVTASLKIANQAEEEFSGVLTSEIQDCPSCETVEQDIRVPAQGEVTAEVSFDLTPKEVRLWDFEHPNLYRLTSTLENKAAGNPVHTSSDRFGIRKIEAKGDQLLLNGEAIHLNGFNRVADHRAYGQTEPDHLVKFDIDAMKAMGGNFTRIMHYPQATNLLDYCDEVGMLLIEEIPVWGKGSPELIPNNPLTKQWLREMIERDYNHPSVVGWSVANEIADGNLEGRKMSPKVYDYVKTMLAYVHSLDSSRLKTYVSFTVGNAEKPGDDPADLCDIVCFNSYGDAASVAKKCHKLWPNKPLFVSEIGLGQIGLDPDEAVLAESLKTAIKDLEKLNYVVGSSLWTYNDYRSNYEGTPPSQNRAWGVYNVWRQPKQGARQIKNLYASQSPATELPTMDTLPDRASGTAPVDPPDGRAGTAPTIWTVVPLEKSCMVGFSVSDEADDYEIRYTNGQGQEKQLGIEQLRGAAKIYDLAPDTYTISIRRVTSTGPGPWSLPYEVTIQ